MRAGIDEMNEKIAIKQLAHNIYLFTDLHGGYFGNATVIITTEGPVIVDVLRDKAAFDYIEKFIYDLGYKKPAAIIYTHWHADHTCGNGVFNDCKIIASEYTRGHLECFIQNDLDRLKSKGILEQNTMPLLPNMTFQENIQCNIGQSKLELIHCPGHSFDSILVYDIDSQTLIAGDNLVGKEVSFFVPPVTPPDETDAKCEDLSNAFSVIETFNSRVIVPGHGNVMKPEELLYLNKTRYGECLSKGIKYVE